MMCSKKSRKPPKDRGGMTVFFGASSKSGGAIGSRQTRETKHNRGRVGRTRMIDLRSVDSALDADNSG